MPNRRHSTDAAFTILELLVGMTLFAVVLGITLTAVSGVTTVYKATGAEVDAFHRARVAFNAVSHSLSSATLQTYYDYEYPDDDTTRPPERLSLRSDLHFISGPTRDIFGGVIPAAVRTPGHAAVFQAPAGYLDEHRRQLRPLHQLLNVVGFYVEYGKGDRYAPRFIKDTNIDGDLYRFRLIQVTQPADRSEVFASTADHAYDKKWVESLALSSPDHGDKHVLAENILVLVLRPKDPSTPLAQPTDIAPHYKFDSRQWERDSTTGSDSDIRRNQLPPVVEVTMVSIDDASAIRLEELSKGNAHAFLGLVDLFDQSANTAAYRRDLDRLRRKLDDYDLRYRVFVTDVGLPESGWAVAAPAD